MRWGALSAGLATALVLSADARAEMASDPTTDFRIDFDFRSDFAHVCVAIPRDRATDPTCAGLPVDKIGSAMAAGREQTIFAAIAREGPRSLLVTVSRAPAAPELGPDLASYAEAMKESFAERGNVIESVGAPTRTRINGVQVVAVTARTKIIGPAGASVEQSVGAYSLAGEKANYIVFTSSDVAHEADATRLVERSLPTLHLAPRALGRRAPSGRHRRHHLLCGQGDRRSGRRHRAGLGDLEGQPQRTRPPSAPSAPYTSPAFPSANVVRSAQAQRGHLGKGPGRSVKRAGNGSDCLWRWMRALATGLAATPPARRRYQLAGAAARSRAA